MRSLPWLEGQTKRKLDKPRIVDLTGNHAELGVAQTLIGLPKLDAVEQVESLRAEGDSHLFGDSRLLHQGKVPVVYTGAAKNGIGTGFISKVPSRGRGKALGIKPATKPTLCGATYGAVSITA